MLGWEGLVSAGTDSADLSSARLGLLSIVRMGLAGLGCARL